MKPESVALIKRRISLLESIAKSADEISRIDIRLKSITGDMIINEQRDWRFPRWNWQRQPGAATAKHTIPESGETSLWSPRAARDDRGRCQALYRESIECTNMYIGNQRCTITNVLIHWRPNMETNDHPYRGYLEHATHFNQLPEGGSIMPADGIELAKKIIMWFYRCDDGRAAYCVRYCAAWLWKCGFCERDAGAP